MSEQLTFLNYEIQSIYSFFKKQSLSPAKSRMRTRFCKLLEERLAEIEESKKEIMKEFCELDENMELKQIYNSVTGETSYKIKEGNNDKLAKELYELMNEELIIEVTVDKQVMIQAVKDIILNIEEKLNNQSSPSDYEYDRWCEIFENWYYNSEGFSV